MSDHRKKLSLNEANSIKKNADNEYKYTVNAAKKKRDESIDAARSQYNKVVAEANKQYKQNKTISYAEYQAILANAKQKKSDSEAEAWKQYQAVLKQAKAQHTDVVAEIQGEVTDSMNAQSALSRWYAKHNIFKGIAQDADHAFERITNVKNGMATIADANAQADAVKRKQDSIKVGQATGRTTDLGPIGKDNMAGVFGGHAAGGPITKTQISLVGEQGPELAYDPKTGKARLLGIKGAQVTTVRAGEHILTANETKKAMNGGVGTTLKGFAGGAGGGITMGLLGGGDSETVDGKKKRKDLNSDKDLKNSEKDLKKFQKNSKSIWKKTESDTEKKLKDQNKTVNKFYSKLTDDSDKHLKDTQDNNKDRWSQMYDDTKHYNKSIHDYATKEQDKLRKDIGKNTNRIYSTWKNDWRITSGAFNSEFKKLRPYSKNGMNGAITSLNQGVSNINRLVSAFGGNSAILPQVSHYATGTNGRIASDELAMVNDALGSNWKEIVELPSGGMIEATQRNAVMPLPAGSRVFNGEQSKRLKEQGIVTAHHATGTMSSEEVDKIVKSKLKSPQASWNTDFESKVTSGIGTRLKQSLTSNNKGSSNKAGVPWYKALWNVISDLMGTAAGGPWLHSPGSGWVHTDSFGSSRGGGRVHDGNDFSSGQGAIIHAMHGGEVIYAGGPPAGWGPIGYNIITKGRDGQYVIYQEFGNAGNSRVSVGDKVKTGQAIATLGHSGLGTGPHVHVGASKNHPHHNGGYTTSGWEDITKMTGGDDGTDEKPKTADDKRLEALVKKELGKKAISYITSNWGSEVTGGSYKGGYSVDMIKKAAKAMHTSISGEKLHQLQLLIKNESGGNPGITGINDGDGSGPAMGLLQYKRGTFMNYAMPGHHNIKSAYDQLLAFFNDSNWYSDIGMGYNGKYGEWRGLASGPSGHRRYANGGIVNQHQMAEIAEGNLPEAIVPMDDSKRNRGYEVLGKTVSAFANDLQDASKNGVATKDDINTLAGLLSDTNKLLKSVVQAVYDTAVTRKGLANIVSSENKLNKIKKNRSLGLGG